MAGFLEALRTGADGARPLASSSASRTVTAVRGWHKFLLAEGTTSQDPSATVRPPQPGRRLPKALSIEEVRRLLEAAGIDDSPVSLRDRALLEVLYATGARISEAVGLVVDDLDADSRVLRLFGKGRKERVVPMGTYAWEALDAYLVRGRPVLAERGRGVPQVFLNTLGRPLSRQSAWAVLQQAAERAGLAGAGVPDERHISPHTLRHSFATHLLAGGACRPGDAWTRIGHHHPDLHEGHRRPSAGGLRHKPSARAGLSAECAPETSGDPALGEGSLGAGRRLPESRILFSPFSGVSRLNWARWSRLRLGWRM